ncbi:MAG: bifunctional hydroxymethylpyrimidine kinase/phosphomethylpyrimidine kinase [Verrucomicrobia bacterium]|nr:bifunctional hydroxymethylpyrimidine kinase/phosphomethylpyrimidine kinase [Verrucomicrobiota bacterium]
MPASPPVVLTIAGSDCSSGAGIQADLKTFSAFGCYGLTALTSVVAETPGQVSLIQPLDSKIIAEQISVLAKAFPIAAAKTGMLGGCEQIEAVISAWQTLSTSGVPLVIDPVMIATSGARLLDEKAVALLTDELIPLAMLITPNLDEAAVLLGRNISSREQMESAAHELSQLHRCAVLLKGGHLPGEDTSDLLIQDGVATWFESRRICGVRTHGTGCTYSAAITAGLAKGLSLVEAVSLGKQFVYAAIASHFRWGDVDALNTFNTPS